MRARYVARLPHQIFAMLPDRPTRLLLKWLSRLVLALRELDETKASAKWQVLGC